jgi:hypothetical protein
MSDGPPREDFKPTTESLETLPESVLGRLFAHFTTVIAPTMVWVDSEHNEYKRLVIASAATQRALRYAILAIAAAHMPDQSLADVELSRAAYANAMLMITERVRRMAGSNLESSSSSSSISDQYAGTQSCDTNAAILAAALILSNHSLFKSELSLAQIHRQAVRVLIKSMTFGRSSNDRLFTFLRNQAAIYDVLACTTMFDPERIKHAILPTSGHRDVPFGQFLKTIHEITTTPLVERDDQRGGPQPIAISDVEDRLELARSATLVASAAMTASCGGSVKDDFVRVVTAYHHAGVLYAYTRLSVPKEPHLEEYHASRLFSNFEKFADLHTSLYNLAWPIFIAGICSWPSVERIRTVSNLSKMMFENTRLGYHSNISRFHQELWDSPHHQWPLLARMWESKGVPIIAV